MGDLVAQVYWHLLQAGHRLSDIDSMDILRYLELMIWRAEQDSDTQDAYIDDVM